MAWVPDRVRRWSLSAYHAWKKCPLVYKIERLERSGVDTSNYYMERGDHIHKAIEMYIKGSLTWPKLVGSFQQKPPMKFDRKAREMRPTMTAAEIKKGVETNWRATFAEARRRYARKILPDLVEEGFAFNAKWEEQHITNDYRTTNWGPIWLSGKYDHVAFPLDEPGVMLVTDWKTGQENEELFHQYLEQLELYALTGLLKFPTVNVVRPSLSYLDTGKIFEEGEYTRADLPSLKQTWEKRVAPMFLDRAFKPTPHNKCQWCAYGQERGDKRCRF